MFNKKYITKKKVEWIKKRKEKKYLELLLLRSNLFKYVYDYNQRYLSTFSKMIDIHYYINPNLY